MIQDMTKVKPVALTRLVVYWKEGFSPRPSSTYYSIDSPLDRARGNYRRGVQRLMNNILIKNRGRWRRALIYINVGDNANTCLADYQEGEL